MMTPHDRYLPIGDYALIGDRHSTALVSLHGSIDWACLRRFDNGSAFARIRDHDNGGHYSICPVEPVLRTHRRYLDNTMVLQTTMVTESGTIVVTDAFTMSGGGAQHPRHELLRTIDCTAGRVLVDVTIKPRFDYGNATPWIRAHAPGIWSAVAGDDAMFVQAEHERRIDAASASLNARIELEPGGSLGFVLVSLPAHLIDVEPRTVNARAAIETTTGWWTNWSTKTTATGPHADLLNRSALILKALCCAPTGAIIAAPTTSLPEIAGGTSNWDYHACWIRDATLTLGALATVGHHGVAKGFRRFIMRTAAGDASELQIMYGPYGERRIPEIELDLEGWRESRPVRTGNAAANQIQLDVYGHLVDARDERMIKTVDAIQKQLGTPDGFIRRQTTGDTASDDTARREGVFLLCSFWLVEILALQGHVTEATALFRRLAGLANDVGLFAEEYSPDDHEFLGNFPQAFTHLGFIAAEHRLRMCSQEHDERNDHT
jgi:GH15 family glucan-1,4-alpha-glucosidase